MRRQVVPVDQQLDNVMQRQIEKNPTILSLLFKTVIYCGQHNNAPRGHQHNNAPRGHREEGPMEGNFQALLAFRVESDDDTLQQHLENAPRSAKQGAFPKQPRMRWSRRFACISWTIRPVKWRIAGISPLWRTNQLTYLTRKTCLLSSDLSIQKKEKNSLVISSATKVQLDGP